MVKSVADWLPSIEEANFVGYLASPRNVIANAEKSDKRHSIIKRIGNRNCFISVFSGKIDQFHLGIGGGCALSKWLPNSINDEESIL